MSTQNDKLSRTGKTELSTNRVQNEDIPTSLHNSIPQTVDSYTFLPIYHELKIKTLGNVQETIYEGRCALHEDSYSSSMSKDIQSIQHQYQPSGFLAK